MEGKTDGDEAVPEDKNKNLNLNKQFLLISFLLVRKPP
jgi:hypothetical protein